MPNIINQNDNIQFLSATMNQNNQLLSILQGCLNSNTVQASQRQLVQYSNRSNFIPQLLQLIPNQSNQIIIMILSTVKNFCQQNYSNPNPNSLTNDQKQILRNNLFNLFYIINTIPQAVNMYKQIVYIVVSVDFENYTNLFYNLIKQDLQGSISASVYFSRQVARFYQWLNMKQRDPLEQFINNLFPKFQDLVQKIMSDYNNQTRKLLQQILQMFYSAFHIQVPQYLRSFNNLDKWLLYFRTILKAPLDDFPNNHIQVTRIYVKLFSMYCRDGTDGKLFKGWGAQFRQKYALDLYTQVVQILINPLPSQQIMSNILSCLVSVASNPDLKPLIQQDHCQAIIYKHLLPFMQSTNQDDSYFKNDGLQYIRRCQDLTCHPFRRVSLDLIKVIAQKYNYNNNTNGGSGKSQLIKLIQYSAHVLGNTGSSDKQKQVILIILQQISPLVIKNTYLRQNFQNLTIQYLIPLIKSNNPILVAQTLKTLSTYLKKTNLSTNLVTQLMSLLYDRMCGNNLVVKYYAILSFTQLLYDKQALQSARPYFQNILQIYVKLLQTIDHQCLISCLQSIVKSFSNQIVGVSVNLSDHLFNLFYSLHNKQAQQQQDQDQENQTKQASAALSTIKQILNSPLTNQQYYHISEKVMILLQGLCSDYDDYFQQILNIVNTLVYKAHSQIVNYQFMYLLCRKLLQGNNSILQNCQNKDFIQIISQAQKADTQYSQSLISILKNLIQKMPNNILHKYEYSCNPQILLCMIQNKKLSTDQLSSLNTSQLDTQWSLIIQSYAYVVYGIGQVCNPHDLKMQSGISLYPWIEYKLDLQVIKRFMLQVQDQQADDDYYQQNTVQMLEQLANQDDDQDDDYYVSSGGNYSYMYDSPYDCMKDQGHLVSKLKVLPGNQYSYILGQLKPKHAAKLQEMLSK